MYETPSNEKLRRLTEPRVLELGAILHDDQWRHFIYRPPQLQCKMFEVETPTPGLIITWADGLAIIRVDTMRCSLKWAFIFLGYRLLGYDQRYPSSSKTSTDLDLEFLDAYIAVGSHFESEYHQLSFRALTDNGRPTTQSYSTTKVNTVCLPEREEDPNGCLDRCERLTLKKRECSTGHFALDHQDVESSVDVQCEGPSEMDDHERFALPSDPYRLSLASSDYRVPLLSVGVLGFSLVL